MRHTDRRPVYLCAHSENEKFVWLEALEKASQMKDGEIKGQIDLTEYWATLNLDPAKNPTSKEIDRAYKKAALKAHPDKGGDSFAFKAVTDAYEIICSCLQDEEESKKYNIKIVKLTIKKGPPGVGFGMVVVEDSKKGDIVVKDVLEGLCLVGETNGETVVKGDVVVGIEDDDITNWPLTRVVARLNNFRVPVNSNVTITFSRRIPLRDEKPDLANEDDFETTPDGEPTIIMTPPPPPDEGGDEGGDEPPIIMMPPDGEEHPAMEHRKSRAATMQTIASHPALEQEFNELRIRNEDLEIELADTKEALTLAEAKLGSLERQVEAAEFQARENAERAQHAEVEFQRVLLSTEEYHQARRDQNLEPAVSPATSAKTLKEARSRAIAAVAASDPTGNMLRKWEREGDSAEDKLKRLEARLAAKGLLKIAPEDPMTRETMRVRRASLENGLNPNTRRKVDDLQAVNIMHKGGGIRSAQKKIMSKKLNQRLKYRPNKSDLVKGGILKPGASGHAYRGRNV